MASSVCGIDRSLLIDEILMKTDLGEMAVGMGLRLLSSYLQDCPDETLKRIHQSLSETGHWPQNLSEEE